MPTVKYSVSAYVADGTTTDYLITWDYLDDDHITVEVDGISNADPTASHTFTKINNTTVRVTDGIGGAIAAGSEIQIRRNTPITTRPISFSDGSALLAADLNKNSDYLLYSMQEVLDTVDAAAQDGAVAAEVATTALRDETIVLKADTLAARDTTQGYLATVQSDATDADNHRIAAAASEAAALASENAASASETASANSATDSANSATASAASAAAGLASEQAADVSEAAALASEVAAAASQVAAATSETNAATSEANAAASFDNLDDRYLGAKATAPTVDNDGDALLTGALYWNSTSDEMYVWNGSAWDTFNSTQGIADGATSTQLTINDTSVTSSVELVGGAGLDITGNADVSGNVVADEFYNGTRKQYDVLSNGLATGDWDSLPRNSVSVINSTFSGNPYTNVGVGVDFSTEGQGYSAYEGLEQRGVQLYFGDTQGQTFLRKRQGSDSGAAYWHPWERIVTSKAPSDPNKYGGVIQVRGTNTNAITRTTSPSGFEALKTGLYPHHVGNQILVMGTIYGSANDDAHAWLEYRINSGGWVRNTTLNGTYNSGAAFGDFSIIRGFAEPDQQVGFSTHVTFNPNTTGHVEVRVMCSCENTGGFNLNIGTSRDTSGSYNNTTTKSSLVLMEIAG